MNIIKLSPLVKPINAGVKIPPSKSYTNRALLLSALNSSPVKILNPLISDDTKAMIDCLKTLGIKILEKQNYIKVYPNLNKIPNRTYRLNANLSGTTIRFILALSTIIPGTKIIFGEEGLNKRPISELVDGLTQLGAKIEYLDKKGFPPVKVTSSKLRTGDIKIKGSISSQYLSAILMIAPLVGRVSIQITGNQISKPFIDMTIDIMKYFGVNILNENYRKYTIPTGQKYSAKKYLVEADYSSAGYFAAIAALTKSQITLKNINPKTKQADINFITILRDMGNIIAGGKNDLIITGIGIKPVSVNMENCPDQIQTLAVLASFAKGITKISGVQSLRIKETNRITALKNELKKMGIKVLSTKNTLKIYGGNPKPVCIETYGDHRMAMAFAIAGTKLSGMEISEPDVVNKTFPSFWKQLESIGVKSEYNEKNIVLIGMRGSGKSTVAKILAEKLKKEYLELDKLVAEKAGLTIPEMVEKYGWTFFRDKESETANKVSFENNKIISTGGGVILRQENIDVLKKNGVFIFLNASIKTLIKRIGNYSKLPSLTNKKTPEEELGLVLKQRKQLYRKTADEVIETDNLTSRQVAEEIISKLVGYNL